MNTDQPTELLAPAGDIEAGYAALYYGADAVYLGLPKFSARADATNFTPDELDAFIAYAHSLNRKVYVALNTLVQESELQGVMDALQVCAQMKVDAVIVQDLGVARIIRHSFPELQLHASTQMAIHNLEGALALKKLGFSRVVLARELSLNEIQKIRRDCGLEVEVFIHGALCYSYSGLCSFSSFETARSANRGKCIYSCRGNFKVLSQELECNLKSDNISQSDDFSKGESSADDTNDFDNLLNAQKSSHLFSMKDLALEKDILKLKGLSLKIEGRKKNALYVAAVTHYYRQILDTGRADIGLADNIKQIFARPWTKLHFDGKNKNVIDPEFVGHRGIQIGTVDKVVGRTLTFTPTHSIARFDGIQIDVPPLEKPYGFSLENLVQSGKKTFEAKAHKPVQIALPEHHPFIAKGAPVYLASSTKVKSSYPYQKPKPGAYKNRLPIDVSVYVTRDKVLACVQSQMVDIAGTFEPAKDIEKMNAGIFKAFEKTGDTPFELKELHIENPDKLFVPVSVLNELRRLLYAELEPEKIKRDLPPVNFKTPQQPVQIQDSTTVSFTPPKTPKWLIKTDDIQNVSQIDLATCDEISVLINPAFDIKTLAALPKEKVRISLPPVIRQTQAMQRVIDALSAQGFNKFEIANLSGLMMVPQNADISFDSFIPVLNTQSLASCFELGAARVTLSPEDTLDNLKKLTMPGENVAVCLYQDPALFISANCVRQNDCRACNRKTLHAQISNGKNKYELISKNCETVVVPQTPLCWSDEAPTINAAAYRVDFCYKKYTPTVAHQIFETVRAGKRVKNTSSFNLKKQFA